MLNLPFLSACLGSCIMSLSSGGLVTVRCWQRPVSQGVSVVAKLSAVYGLSSHPHCIAPVSQIGSSVWAPPPKKNSAHNKQACHVFSHCHTNCIPQFTQHITYVFIVPASIGMSDEQRLEYFEKIYSRGMRWIIHVPCMGEGKGAQQCKHCTDCIVHLHPVAHCYFTFTFLSVFCAAYRCF
jgi:hypothetical protein